MTLCVDLHYKGAAQVISTTAILGKRGYFFGKQS